MTRSKPALDTDKAAATLNQILEQELAGVVRYVHYSLMIYGPNRLPIVSWMRKQANESLDHAAQAGEHITTLGGHPSLKIGKLLETQKHDIQQILEESLEHERRTLESYYELLELVRDKNICLEEYARTMISNEETHIAEVDKMMRKPGTLGPARS